MKNFGYFTNFQNDDKCFSESLNKNSNLIFMRSNKFIKINSAVDPCTVHKWATILHFMKIFWFIDIRLSNGTDATEGIIEINEDDDWRTICNDSFNDLAAAIVCKQLRFGRPVLYRGNSLVNSGAYHYYYYYYYSYYTPSCSENTQRLFHCFPYYIYYGSCYDTYLKCSSKYKF